ncbi:PREDICTED: titin-like [Cyphomyrmex costatus]|uniref:titin-like n=1 Tax=Cyphomyrmex costatus TaxID=456900 RepID=UPI0008522A5B|nr:PREDICTED: titin-like [Cyphomyrmex costatus]
MENKNSSNKDLSERTTYQKNAKEIKRHILAESKTLIIKDTSEGEEERFLIKETNCFQKEIMKENNGILKETVTSESFSKRIDSTEKYDKLKREINNPGKIGDMATVTVDRYRCQRPLRDIIGKREQRREELEKMEGDLRQRLDMLECSIPAVMVWNIWRLSQGAPVCRIKRILEKQFKDTRELSCRSTPSCHYDCRVREVEAERKLALKKVEEARTLWSEKLMTLEERKKKLYEARKIQEEQRNAIERLNEENRILQEAMEKKAMEMDESCQCGDTQCKQRHLRKVSSVTSIESGDIQCLEKLQRLAEEEVITKREIIELERREEAYMRTLQQADEMWSKMEGDVVSTTSTLQKQLDMKTAANQQLANRVCELEDALEKCRARLATCRTELEKFLSIEKVEATIGRDDDVAKVADKEVAVKAKVVHRPIGRIDDIATVKDDEVLAKVEIADEGVLAKTKVVDEEVLAITEVEDKEALARVVLTDADVEATFIVDDKLVSVKPDLTDLAVDRPIDLIRIEDAESIVRPEDVAYEQQRFKEVREYLAQLGSLEELYTDDGVPCAHDFVCNDVVSSPTGMTDEELIALDIEHPALMKKRDEIVITEEQERQFQKELVKKPYNAVDGIEKREKKENEIPSVEIERKIAEKVEKRIAEIVDVKETVTPRTVEEADDRLVTMPKDRTPEVNKIEAGNKQNQGIVIQRDTILSWIDAINMIRTTAAKHPDCSEVKKDADILAEQVGTYVGIKAKEVEEENAAIDKEGKQKKVIEKNEIKIKIDKNEKVISKTKLQDELIILKAKEMEPVIKTDSVPFPNSEEASAEVKVPMEAIAESELLPTFTKEEVSIGIKLPTAVSIEDSFQPPTIHNKKDLKNDTIPLAIFEPTIEEIKAEETRVEAIINNAKEIEIPKNKITERKAVVEDLVNNELITKLEANDKIVNFIEEKMLVVPKVEKEEQKIIFNHIEKIDEKEKDIPTEIKIKEITVENEKSDKVLPVTEIEESKFVEHVAEKSKQISPLDETKITDTKEIIRTDKIVEVSPVAEMEEAEQEKTMPAVDVKEVEKIMPETISPTVDITEVEMFEPDKFHIIDDKKAITNAIEEKIKTEEPTPILNKKEKSLLLDAVIKEKIENEKPAIKKEEIEIAESLLIAEVTEKEKNEVTESPQIEVIEKKEKNEAVKLPPISDMAKEEKIEVAEVSPITDIIKKEQIESKELLLNMIKKDEIEAEKLLPRADVIIEEKNEIIQPVPTIPIIKKEMEEEIDDSEKMLKVEIKKEKDEEIEEVALPKKLIPTVELPEEEEEIPQVEKEEILTTVPLPKKPTPKIKKEIPEEEKPEMVQIELKIPIAEIKLTEMEVTTIPFDPRLVAQPYLIVTKIKEKEQIIPTKPPCYLECCLRPPIETTRQFEIPQTDVPQTEVVQTEVIQAEVVQTKMMQTEIVQNEVEQAKVVHTEAVKTEVVQITSQTISTAEPSRIRNISEYLKPTELKAPRTEITSDRPEITGRKMLKRLKDQSTVTTSSTGSPTDKTSHVSHDRVVRDERERARVPTDELLRSIKIAAGLTRPDTEREIRTINYGRRSDETGRAVCNCCSCGKTPTPPPTRPRLEVQPQIDATPPAVAAFERMFIRPKIDHPISHDKLCSDCKAKMQSRMPRERHHVEKIIKKISHDQESCDSVSLTGKTYHVVSRKRVIEKRDQACLAKIHKQKPNPIEQKRKDDLQPILEDSEKSTVEPLSSSCICFKLEKTGVKPIKKGNCYCED